MNLSLQRIVAVLLIIALIIIGCWRVLAERSEPAPTTPSRAQAVVTPATPEPQPSSPRSTTPTSAPPTATLLPSPTPTPTSTPMMDIQDWHEAFAFQRHGDYERAIRGYRTLLASQPAAADARTIRFHLGETYLLDDDPATASMVLAEYVADYPDDATVWFMLGRTREMLHDWVGAVDAFRAYRELDDALADYAGLRIATALVVLGQTGEAAEEYATVLEVTPDDKLAAEALEGLADIAISQGNYSSAAEHYRQAADRAPESAAKARLLRLAGTNFLAVGRQADGVDTLTRVVKEHLSTDSAYIALGELLALGEEKINQRTRGLVYYYNADYRAAVNALTRYLVTEPAPLGDSLYFLGRSYEQLGRWTSAISAYDQLIENYPDNDRYGAAWVRKARAQRRLGDTEDAIALLREFAAEVPEDPLVDDALFEAARALEALGRRSEAADLYRRIVTRYPEGDNAAEASFRVGILPYLDGDYETAREAWQLAAEHAKTAEVRARALLWAGKAALALGDIDTAAEDFTTAAKIASLSFDGLRAQALLKENGADVTNRPTAPPPTLSAWLGLSAETLARIDRRLQADRRYQRGWALLAVGLRNEGLAELKALRDAYWESPIQLSRLAMLFDDPDSRHLSIASAERALTLTRTSPPEAPVELAHLAYPVDYRELIMEESERYGLDPRLMAALIRQESRFNPTATSYASAHGLTQVIPSTGWYIAGQLGVRNFDVESLYRPYRSVQFGAWYLAEQLDKFGDPVLALAAYNGGPENTRRWQRLTDDVDIFVASIHLDQTQEYVRRVMEQYMVYQMLYDEQLSPVD